MASSVVSLADAATSYSYSVSGSAYVPAEVSIAAASSTASAPASTVIVTTNTTCTVIGGYKLALRIANVIGGNAPPAPSPDSGSLVVTTPTAGIA